MGLPLVFASLATITATVEFSEGTEKKQVAPLDLLTTFMEGLKSIVPAGTIFAGQESAAAADTTTKGVNPGRLTVDPGSVRLHEAALKFAEENKVDYITATNKVIEKHPELAIPGGAGIGQV